MVAKLLEEGENSSCTQNSKTPKPQNPKTPYKMIRIDIIKNMDSMWIKHSTPNYESNEVSEYIQIENPAMSEDEGGLDKIKKDKFDFDLFSNL